VCKCVCLRLCVLIIHAASFVHYRTNMSLTSILSAEAIENAVKDCQGSADAALKIFAAND